MNPTDSQYRPLTEVRHAAGDALPFTGHDLLFLAGIASAMLLLGLLMYWLSRARQSNNRYL